MNGSGYPRGSKGEEILIEARILAVADVIESMATHGPYRPAKGVQAELAEIEQGRGMVYDSAQSMPACGCSVRRATAFHPEGSSRVLAGPGRM